MFSSVPISPPVTPKSYSTKEHHESDDQEELHLPPCALSSTMDDLSSSPRRKFSARRYSKAMATADKDAITFRDPFAVGNVYLTTGRYKSTPTRSPSPSTRGSFTMDVFSLDGVLNNNGFTRKRRYTATKQITQCQPTTASSILNTERHVKKYKTDAAAAYDNVDITMTDEQVFQDDPDWIPDMDAFDNLPSVRVVWKGSPLAIDQLPYYNLLHPGEVNIASTLRLTPEQYLKCKRSLILAAQEFDKLHINFRKSDAQKCVRIDVNKTSMLWSVFSRLGWFNPRSSSSACHSP